MTIAIAMLLYIDRTNLQADDVIATREYYSRIGVWPRQPFEIDPKGWLANFSGKRDVEIAVALLDSFMFINEQQTFKMFETAFAALASEPYISGLPGADLETQWGNFRRRALVSFPTDDQDSASGSGYRFVRMARQKLNLPDGQLLDPGQLVVHLSRQTEARPIVFVDDIVGSGNQFTDTWTREVVLEDGSVTSLETEAVRLNCHVFYAPAVCTAVGLSAINMRAPQVRVRAAHFLPSVYSANHPNTLLVPNEMRAELVPFIKRHSARAGISQFATFGWGDLALALAFEHSTPDLALPIFTAERPGWRPLVTRR